MTAEEKKTENAETASEQQVKEVPEAVEAKTKTVEQPAEAAQEPEADEKPKVQLSEKMETLIKTVEEMSVLELSELVKALEDRFGVSAAAPVAVAAQGAPGAAAEAVEEKSVFDVVLTEVGSQKIQVIKEIRALTSLGLKEAKDLVEAAPKEVKTDVTKEDADKMKQQLEAVGAKIELK